MCCNLGSPGPITSQPEVERLHRAEQRSSPGAFSGCVAVQLKRAHEFIFCFITCWKQVESIHVGKFKCFRVCNFKSIQF